MTHKEFYFWLQGYLYGKLEDKTIEIGPIIQKMDMVKENETIRIGQPNTTQFPLPINPFPVKEDPYSPPYEVYCGDKKQLND